MSRRAPYEILVVTAVSIFGLAAPAQALTDNWLSTSSSLWQVGPWSLARPPLATDSAVFNVGSIYSVNFDAATGDPTINDLQVTALIVSFATVAGPTRTLNVTDPSGPRNLTVANASLWLGSGGAINVNVGNEVIANTGSLVLSNGSQLTVARNISIGATPGSTGSLSIVNAGSVVTQISSFNITVGSNTTGSGLLAIGTSSTGGTLTTGTLPLIVNKTGQVRIGSGAHTGTLNANGNVLIDGGVLERGAGSQFNMAEFYLLTIQNGGRASFTGDHSLAPGTLVNVNANSTLEVISGTLNVSKLAEVNVSSGQLAAGAVNLADAVGGFGALSVSGMGASVVTASSSDWGSKDLAAVTFSDHAVGEFPGGLRLAEGGFINAQAVVEVKSGADLTVGDLSMAPPTMTGFPNRAELTITGAGSTVTLNPSKNLVLGPGGLSGGFGDINVLDNAVLTVGAGGVTTLFVGGEININGGTADLKTLNRQGGVINFTSGSLSYLGDLTVGVGGLLGTNLTLSSDRALTLSGTTTVDATRVLTLAGGTLNTGSVVLSGTLNFNSGTLGITGPGGVTLNTGGKLAGNGTIPANVQNDGVVAPGTSPGTLTITGNYTQGATGTLKIELASLASFDKLIVTGTANFAGTLDIDLIGFTPAAGNSFDILDFATRNGSFNLDLPLLPGSLQWNTSLLYTTGFLSVNLAGDFDLNGKVDAADYVVWRNGLGTTFTANDYTVWREHFGQSIPAASAGTPGSVAVPEPASFVAVAIVCGFMSVASRRFFNRRQ